MIAYYFYKAAQFITYLALLYYTSTLWTEENISFVKSLVRRRRWETFHRFEKTTFPTFMKLNTEK